VGSTLGQRDLSPQRVARGLGEDGRAQIGQTLWPTERKGMSTLSVQESGEKLTQMEEVDVA